MNEKIRTQIDVVKREAEQLEIHIEHVHWLSFNLKDRIQRLESLLNSETEQETFEPMPLEQALTKVQNILP